MTVHRRLDWADLAKGVAILLVVVGHFDPMDAPPWWREFVDFIYLFHLPPFFLVAGMLSNRSRPYPLELRRKASRLLVPYLSIAVLFLAIKLVSGSFAHLEFPVTPRSVAALLWDPLHSYVPLLWFLYSMFFAFALHPLLHRVLRSDWAVLVLSYGLFLWVGSDRMGLTVVFTQFAYFALGICLEPHLARIQSKSLILLAAAVAVFTAGFLAYDQTWKPLAIAILGTSGGMAVVLACMSWDRTSVRPRFYSWFLFLGNTSMVLYILHTPFESAVRILMGKLNHGRTTTLAIALAILAGILGPLVVNRLVFRKSPLARRLLLGEAK